MMVEVREERNRKKSKKKKKKKRKFLRYSSSQSNLVRYRPRFNGLRRGNEGVRTDQRPACDVWMSL
jgi:hypothetical protein